MNIGMREIIPEGHVLFAVHVFPWSLELPVGVLSHCLLPSVAIMSHAFLLPFCSLHAPDLSLSPTRIFLTPFFFLSKTANPAVVIWGFTGPHMMISFSSSPTLSKTTSVPHLFPCSYPYPTPNHSSILIHTPMMLPFSPPPVVQWLTAVMFTQLIDITAGHLEVSGRQIQEWHLLSL